MKRDERLAAQTTPAYGVRSSVATDAKHRATLQGYPFQIGNCKSCGGGIIVTKNRKQGLCGLCKRDPLVTTPKRPASRWKRFLALFALGLTACSGAQGTTADNHHPTNLEAEQDIEFAWCQKCDPATFADAGADHFDLNKCEALFEQQFPVQAGNSTCTQDQVTACEKSVEGDSSCAGEALQSCLSCFGASP